MIIIFTNFSMLHISLISEISFYEGNISSGIK